jgi:phage repressor protein C with HTH and peptisase S24 domain
MKSLAEIITESRKNAGLNQSELARRLNITPQSVQAWESGRATPRPAVLSPLAKTLGIEAAVLIAAILDNAPGDTREKSLRLIRQAYEDRKAELESESEEDMSILNEKVPLDEDKVCAPFLIEVELSAGSGRTAIEESRSRTVCFDKSTLRSQGVRFDNVFCVTVHGDSMGPVFPDGSTVAVDTGSTIIRDGKIYAINQTGHLRVKTLHRLPDGGVRIRSFNREDYPDEEYSLEEMDQRDISIIGRVFWSSSFW